MIQTRKNPIWIDESGTQIPFNRLTKLEIMRENELAQIVKEATIISNKLASFKNEITERCDKIIQEFMISKNVEKIGKGNFTLFNFDRSIQVELKISDRITFDDLTLKAAKEKFDEFINETIESKEEFGKEMVNDAFSTSRGKVDVKKVMNLLKWETRVKHPAFQEGIKLLKEGIRRPDSKAYYQVKVKDDAGEYQNVDLNFSSI